MPKDTKNGLAATLTESLMSPIRLYQTTTELYWKSPIGKAVLAPANRQIQPQFTPISIKNSLSNSPAIF